MSFSPAMTMSPSTRARPHGLGYPAEIAGALPAETDEDKVEPPLIAWQRRTGIEPGRAQRVEARPPRLHRRPARRRDAGLRRDRRRDLDQQRMRRHRVLRANHGSEKQDCGIDGQVQ
jgi:hypothetical protein